MGPLRAAGHVRGRCRPGTDAPSLVPVRVATTAPGATDRSRVTTLRTQPRHGAATSTPRATRPSDPAHHVLNARLYRTAWLVAGVAIIVALLTLQTRPAPPEPDVPFAVDGAVVRDSAGRLEGVAPLRVPGSQDDLDAAQWMEEQLAGIPGAGAASPDGPSRVKRQEFVARHGRSLVRLVNVYLAVPGTTGTGDRDGIVVVAPRDTPARIRAGATSSALLVEMARLWATSSHERPLLFVSTDGSTVGNAGIRWFLSRFSDFRIGAVVVLDAVADAEGREVHIWSRGRDGRQALGLESIARTALERGGMEPVRHEGLWTQRGAHGRPQLLRGTTRRPWRTASRRSPWPRAPTARRDSRDLPDEERISLVGEAAMGLLGTLDQVEVIDGPTRGVVLADRELSAGVLRIVILLLTLPLLVAAVDALARLRRAGVRLRPGLRALLWRAVPLAAAVIILHLLGVAGLVPQASAGAPPLPVDVPLTPRGGLALGIPAIAGVATWLATRRRARRVGAAPAAEAAAGLIALAATCTVAWAVRPSALLLLLPAAHAVLIATAVPRRWQVTACAAAAVLPLVGLAAVMGQQLDRDPLFGAWYLVATTAEGARGVLGPALGIALVACMWSMAALVVLRAKKGLVAARPPVRRRPPAPRGARAR